MRLSERYRQIIRQTAEKIFGTGTKVYLFGSRLDEARRGGDIDLYIVPAFEEDIYEKKTRFLVELWKALGEQKIDVIIARDPQRPIERIAIEEGVKL